ncbi:hypothetical protein CASFOL_017862 [Castilleja foliolosa]|uniref:Late embryogenesis abundant protein n=1 Tax=Castilleja foliolosa TaxID=1961234 RepID=A0ABD3DA75_9LAMI
MARNGVKNTTMLLIKPFSVQELAFGRCMSKLAGKNNHDHEKTDKVVLEGKCADEQEQTVEDRRSCWIPHPRTGIYFPKGQEWVMEDVPNDAASLDSTFWLRSVDGVDDKHKHI